MAEQSLGPISIDGKTYFSAVDITSKHGFTRPRLDQYVARGHLKATRIGHRVLFEAGDVAAWEAKRQHFLGGGRQNPPKAAPRPLAVAADEWLTYDDVDAKHFDILISFGGRLYVHYHALEVTVRAANCLDKMLGRPSHRHCAVPCEAFLRLTKARIAEEPGVGKVTAQEIADVVDRIGALSMDTLPASPAAFRSPEPEMTVTRVGAGGWKVHAAPTGDRPWNILSLFATLDDALDCVRNHMALS